MTFRIPKQIVLPLVSWLLLAVPVVAQESTTEVEVTMSSALTALHNGDHRRALDDLRVLLQRHPTDPALLTNAGIAAAHLQDWGLAAGLLRDAVELAPAESASRQALDYVLEKLPVKEIPHSSQFWEVYRQNVLEGVSFFVLAAMGAPLLLLVGFLALRFIADRRRALAQEEPLPRVGFTHIAALFILGLHLTLFVTKAMDLGQPRGTVLPEKMEARSAPDATAPSLFELYAGLEVLILRENGAWTQVQYPGGPTGWIPRESLRASVLFSGD